MKLMFPLAVLAISILMLAGNASAFTAISDCQGLQDIRLDLTGDYYLSSDIDCTGFDFQSIGCGNFGSQLYSGNFDGRGHTISYLTINNSACTSGTFRQSFIVQNTGILRNFTLYNFTDVAATGTQQNTAPIGYNGGYLLDIHVVNSSVAGRGSYIAGLAAQGNGRIERCSVEGSYISKYVVNADYVAGFMANVGSGTVILDSFARGGLVTGYRYTSGFISLGNAGATVNNSYTAMDTSTSQTANDGAFVALTAMGGDNNNFWDADVITADTSLNGVSKTTAEMFDNATFVGAGWDYVNVWNQEDEAGYPYHLSNVAQAVIDNALGSPTALDNSVHYRTYDISFPSAMPDTLCIERNDTLWSGCYDLNGISNRNDVIIAIPPQGVNGLYEFTATVNDTLGRTATETFKLTIYPSATQYIDDCDDFILVNERGNYELLNNIDCSGTVNRTFGASGNLIEGSLNGKGYTIGNLTFATTTASAICSFMNTISSTPPSEGISSPAMVKNLRLENINTSATGTGACSGLFRFVYLDGVVDNVTIKNLTMMTVSGGSGLVSSNLYGNVTNVYLDGVTMIGTGTTSLFSGIFSVISSLSPYTYSKMIENVTLRNLYMKGSQVCGIATSDSRANLSAMSNVGLENFYLEVPSSTGGVKSLSAAFCGSTIQGNYDNIYVRNGTVVYTGTNLAALAGFSASQGVVTIQNPRPLYNNIYIDDVVLNCTVSNASCQIGGFNANTFLSPTTNISNVWVNVAIEKGSVGNKYCFGISNATVLNSFVNNDTCYNETETVAGLTKSTTAEMKTGTTFTSAGWDFTNIWSIDDGIDYPRFQSQPFSTELPFSGEAEPPAPSAPVVTIYHPINGTTYTSPAFPLYTSADLPVTQWYYDIGTGNVSFIPNTTIAIANGVYSLTVYAQGTGGWGYAEIEIFTVNYVPPPPITGNIPLASGTLLSMLMGAAVIMSTLVAGAFAGKGMDVRTLVSLFIMMLVGLSLAVTLSGVN